MSRRILLATGNLHKVRELQEVLQFQLAQMRRGNPTVSNLVELESVEIVSAAAVGGMPPVIENADTFSGNALLKAHALQQLRAEPDDWILADDSGLVVDALAGAPGIYSARYAGPNCEDAANNQKLLSQLNGVPWAQRSARFECVLALVGHDLEMLFHGHLDGHIAKKPAGNAGFGYDPLFIPDGYAQSLAELGSVLKQKISHRARALNQLVEWLAG